MADRTAHHSRNPTESDHVDELKAVVKELNAIKRLLALTLLRDGVPQQAVAKAAGVATLTINQLANGIRAPKTR